MIKSIVILVILLSEFSESLPSIGKYPEPLIWYFCGQNYTYSRHEVDYPPKCHKSITSTESPETPKGRVRRGRTYAPHEAPYAARIFFEDSVKNKKCTGTIIGDRWILTTANCVLIDSEDDRIVGKDARIKGLKETQYTIYYASSDTNNAQEAFVDALFSRPEYNPSLPVVHHNNIGLIKLKTTLSERIDEKNDVYTTNTVCFPNKNDPNTYQNENASEFGWSDGYLSIADHRLRDCDLTGLVCALPDSGITQKTKCPTDAGSPLVQFTETGKAVQIGLSVSEGSDCNNRKFVLLRRHLDWIVQTVLANA